MSKGLPLPAHLSRQSLPGAIRDTAEVALPCHRTQWHRSPSWDTRIRSTARSRELLHVRVDDAVCSFPAGSGILLWSPFLVFFAVTRCAVCRPKTHPALSPPQHAQVRSPRHCQTEQANMPPPVISPRTTVEADFPVIIQLQRWARGGFLHWLLVAVQFCVGQSREC